MPPRISIAARSLSHSHSGSTTSSRLPSSTAALSHVLGLVSNGYLLDGVSRSSVAYLRGSLGLSSSAASSSSASSQAVSSSPSRSLERRVYTPRSRIHQQSRLYTSSSAAQVIDDDDHHSHGTHTHALDGYDHSSRPSSHPRRSLRSLRQSSDRKKSSSPKSPITSDRRFFVYPNRPDEWARISVDFHKRLKHGGFQSAAHFAHDFDLQGCEPQELASISRLFRIFALWRGSAEEADWIWLKDRLESAWEFVQEHGTGQKGLPATIRAIRSYALVELGEAQGAIDLLEGGEKMASNQQVNYSWSPSTSDSIAALVYLRLEEWDLARAQMSTSISKAVSRLAIFDNGHPLHHHATYPTFDTELLNEYENAVLSFDRKGDLLELAKDFSWQTRHLVLDLSKQGHRYPTAVSRIVFEALNSVEAPVAWWIEQSIEQSEEASAAIGSLLFLALTRDRLKLPEATDLFDTLVGKGMKPPATAAVEFCDKIALESKAQGWTLYQRIRDMYPQLPHQALYRALQFSGRAGWTTEEENIWREICVRYPPTWEDRTTSAKHFAHRGRVQECASSLRLRVGEDFEQNTNALEILFTAHINANNSDNAYVVLQKINAIEPRIYPYNSLLQLYADQVNVNAAVRLFDELLASPLRPDLHSYTALISLFAQRRDPVNAENCFKAMIDAGIEPDDVAHAALINASVEAGDWLAAAERWSKLPAETRTSSHVASAVIRALVLLSSPTEHVVSLFRKIKKPSTRTWALVIQSASDSGDMDLARDLYDEMEHVLRASGAKSTSPYTYTLSILLHGYMKSGDGPSARAVYDDMLKREIVPSSVTYGMIIQSFAEARGERSLEQAHDFAMTVHKQVQAGLIADRRHEKARTSQNIFSPLVVAHGRSQNLEVAQSYFDMIGEDESKESVHMYTQLMDVYRRAGEADKVMENWEKAFQLALDVSSYCGPRDPTQDAGKPTEEEANDEDAPRPTRSNENILCIPLSIALDSLSAAGRYYEVKRIWNEVEKAGFGFDAGNYNHLSVALARTGDVIGAFMVADQILLKRYEEVQSRRNEAIRESAHLPSLKQLAKRNNTNSQLSEQDMENILYSPDADAEAGDEDARGLDIVDRPVQPYFGPPNRRSALHTRSPFTAEAKADPFAQLDLRLLQSWRPSDTLWKPSLLTLSVLDTTYAQLEEAGKRRAWVPLTFSDENDAEDDSLIRGDDLEIQNKKRTYGVVLPLFGNTAVRNHVTGHPARKGPLEILRSLNKRYSKLVGLIMFHRKKRLADRIKQDRRRAK
ncbi:hypothetical protein I316_01608 [Kwoniella heveanensis BCC8398]|uniref:Pentatricopeptide repeat domain-containing protein n=1 Tax=Kwoniella heveanensis BCC8398 TaxID=1296120 RepID=A0A1B9GZA5_9TREE|nr:hypothetical protein I316_01608 [Kwoniella heveanensis BCC8398]